MTDIEINTENYKTIILKRYKLYHKFIKINILDYISFREDEYYLKVNIVGCSDVSVAYLLNKAFKADMFNIYSTKVNYVEIRIPHYGSKDEIIITVQKPRNVFNDYSFELEDKILWLITYIKAILDKI